MVRSWFCASPTLHVTSSHAPANLAVTKKFGAALYCATGPHTTGWTDGELNEEDDYVEAEALKAAELHANDPELHSFFRWMAESEQSQKRRARTEYELQIRELDE